MTMTTTIKMKETTTQFLVAVVVVAFSTMVFVSANKSDSYEILQTRRIFYADDELCPVKLLIKLDVLAAGSYIDSLAYTPRDFYHHPCHQLGGRLLRFLRLL